ncbi:MAG: Aromatic amino acid permease [Parcubacteria group bacterium GW2011_GWA2_37_10]|nr:MAG: Aromatic amino acid permease [Parcubacteria group bacterium GW2011_GWA2_37_10]
MFDKELFKNYIYPIATLSGSIIGVGIFSLPYVALKSGIWAMLGYFLVLTLLVIIIHLVFTEISLKTPDFKRFPGFVGHHLGKAAEAVSLVTITFGAFGVLLAYLIIGSEFLAGIFQPYFGGSIFLYAILYFTAVSIIIGLGIKIVSRVEFWALTLLFLSLLFIFVKGFSQIKIGNIFLSPSVVDWKNLFLPYGAIMFALWGTSLIPEVEEMLGDHSANSGRGKDSIRNIVIISTLIPAVVYVLFTVLILGITGGRTTESALTGLKFFLGNSVFLIALFAGVVTTFTAFISQGLTLKKVLIYDMGIKNKQAFIIICLTPLVLFLLGLKSFVPLLSFIGGILLGIDGILILLMYKKIGGKKIIIYPLSLVFLLGVIYEIIYFIK